MAGPYIGWQDAIQQGLIEGGAYSDGYFKNRLDKSILSTLRIIDEQDAVQSVDWSMLPLHLPADLVERILYYRGTGCLFYLSANDRFYFLPYIGKGLDCYGRYTKITPVVWRGAAGTKKDPDIPYIADLELTPIYDVVDISEWTPEMMETSCVLLYDYTPQYSQTILSRRILNEPLLVTMSEIIPFMRTGLANSVGIDGMKIASEDESDSVKEANNSSIMAAINGEKWIPITGSPNLTNLAGSAAADSQQFLMALQALDNYRLSTHGLRTGGLMQKGSQMLQAEEDINAGNVGLILNDRIYQRQKFCNIVNSIWPIGVWNDVSEPVVALDMDGNGIIERNTMDDSGANSISQQPVEEDTDNE